MAVMTGDASPPPSRQRRALMVHQDDIDEGTLPAPTTYNEFKRNMDDSKTSWIRPQGESGRRGFHPIHFTHISFKSTSRASLLCNFLWPVVPAAIAVRCMFP